MEALLPRGLNVSKTTSKFTGGPISDTWYTSPARKPSVLPPMPGPSFYAQRAVVSSRIAKGPIQRGPPKAPPQPTKVQIVGMKQKTDSVQPASIGTAPFQQPPDQSSPGDDPSGDDPSDYPDPKVEFETGEHNALIKREPGGDQFTFERAADYNRSPDYSNPVLTPQNPQNFGTVVSNL
jgi:hypothetical protein